MWNWFEGRANVIKHEGSLQGLDEAPGWQPGVPSIQKGSGPQLYSHKELNSANNLNGLRSKLPTPGNSLSWPAL